MPSVLTSLKLLLQRPKRLQMGALCHRGSGEDVEYLLLTSRDTGRWVIPKGWPIRGLSAGETALREAWEEAGVRGTVSEAPLGVYHYDKRRKHGFKVPVRILVYSVEVESLSDDFPEAKQRSRTWVSAAEAADMVDECGLKAIFKERA